MTDNTKKPNFLCVGGQRCGTTWLYECLLEHPDIFLPSTKELGYFSTVSSTNHTQPMDWYLEHFMKVEDEKMIGEITPSYLVDEQAPKRIKDALGDIKIIIVVRDPIERLVSAYKKGFREQVWDVSLEEFADKNMDLCVERGFYTKQIQRYHDTFGTENVLIKVYEESLSDPISYVEDIYRFLAVDPTFVPKTISSRFNISTSTENNRVKNIVRLRSFLFKVPGMESLTRVVLRIPAVNRFFWGYLEGDNKTKEKKEEPPKVSNAIVAQLKEDTEKLSLLLNKDLLTLWY